MSEKKTTKTLLLSFARLKSEFLAGTQIEFTDKDFNELENWSEEDCAKVLNLLRNRPIDSDGGLCPWCLVRYRYPKRSSSFPSFPDDGCSDCGFGERHGFCDRRNSDYNQFIRDHRLVLYYLGDEKIKQLIESVGKSASDTI